MAGNEVVTLCRRGREEFEVAHPQTRILQRRFGRLRAHAGVGVERLALRIEGVVTRFDAVPAQRTAAEQARLSADAADVVLHRLRWNRLAGQMNAAASDEDVPAHGREYRGGSLRCSGFIA